MIFIKYTFVPKESIMTPGSFLQMSISKKVSDFYENLEVGRFCYGEQNCLNNEGRFT